MLERVMTVLNPRKSVLNTREQIKNAVKIGSGKKRFYY